MKSGPVISLECQVKHTKFTLTEFDLNTILDIPSVTSSPLFQTEGRSRCLIDFAHPQGQINPAHYHISS